MVHLAMDSEKEAVRVEDLADRQKLSPTYLSKILTKLVKAGLILSTPGVNGGYRLLKSPEQITFLEIIQAVEGQEALLKCFMSENGKAHHHKCLIEQAISDAEDKMLEVLSQKTIAGILSQIPAKN